MNRRSDFGVEFVPLLLILNGAEADFEVSRDQMLRLTLQVVHRGAITS